MKYFKVILLGFAVCCVLGTPASAKSTKKDKVLIREEVTINFKDLEINDFVKLVSNVLNKNILLQSPIPGKVDFVSTTPVYKNDLPAILQSVLGAKGYSLVDRGSFLEIVHSKNAAKYNLPLVKNLNGDYLQMVTKIVQIKNVNADFIASKIKHLLSSSSSLVTVRDNNSILITDFPENIKTIENIIKKLESSNGVHAYFYKLKNAQVSYIYPSLLSIVKSRFNSKVETQKVSISSDKASNSIIAVASEKNSIILGNIIAKFDVKGALPIKKTVVISLKNTEVKDVLNVVTKILASKRQTNPTSIPTVVSEPNTNSIIITGIKEDIEEVQSIIKELDKEQLQVYVKARIIEVSKEASEKLGAKYGLTAGKANSSGLYTLALGMGGNSISIDPKQFGIKIPELQSGLALGAAIDFLTTHGAANTVAEPSVLCINNKESKIYVGQTESVITSATTKDKTTDLSRNTYNREDIGLTLKIKPRISNDGKVSLEAETKIEDVVPNSRAGMPTTTKREVTTKAIVKNGESVIVGGLIKDKSGTSISRIPILGHIPLLGNLFTHRSDSGDNLNLVIVLTPYIIEQSENLTSLRKKLAELDVLQEKYNKKFMAYLRQKNKRAVDEPLFDKKHKIKYKENKQIKPEPKPTKTQELKSQPITHEQMKPKITPEAKEEVIEVIPPVKTIQPTPKKKIKLIKIKREPKNEYNIQTKEDPYAKLLGRIGR